MLYKHNSIRFERSQTQSCKIYIFKCLDCPNEIRCRSTYLNTHSGKCISCSKKGPEYLSIYNSMKNSSKKRKMEFKLSFKEFLTFTKINNCHYCNEVILWSKNILAPCKSHTIKTNEKYYLDRKNNLIGYIKNNLVTCCTRCNMAKGNRYSYKEWYGMTAYFRNINY